MMQALVSPPRSPDQCIFAKMSVNYTADLRTTVEPCVFGGDPDCSQCGCSTSTALHWIGGKKLAGMPVRTLVRASIAVGVAMGAVVSRFNGGDARSVRWGNATNAAADPELVQIRRTRL